MIPRIVIRTSRSGWVVEENDRIDDLKVFRSDEPERFIKYIAENVAGIKLDRVVEFRNTEMERERKRLDSMTVTKTEAPQ